jgi:hypothetical protein
MGLQPYLQDIAPRVPKQEKELGYVVVLADALV